MKTNCMEPDAVVSNVAHLSHDVMTIHNKWLTTYAQMVELFLPESNVCAVSNKTIKEQQCSASCTLWYSKLFLEVSTKYYLTLPLVDRQSVELDSQNLFFNEAL